MADEESIIGGSFRDIPFAIDSSSLDGGLKHAIKQFPSRNTQNVETLGIQPRRYSLDIIITEKTKPKKEDYFSYRDRLIAALENEAEGVLIHPLYGRIENVIAVTYSLNESLGNFGDAKITVNFEVNRNTGVPKTTNVAITQANAKNKALKDATKKNISEKFSVTKAFIGNFNAAKDKINGVIKQTKDSTAFIGETADTINEFTDEIGKMSRNINSLVSDPIKLADSFDSLFNSVNGLYASQKATFNTMIGFFGFGEDDTDIQETTAGKSERKRNNDTLNGAVGASALGYAYLAASSIEFETTAEIDDIASQLDDQYKSVLASGSDQSVIDAVTDMRITTLEILEQARIDASQIITIETSTTPARILAFNYYGDDENGEDTVNLNGFTDVSFIEGEVKVLTS